MAKTIDLNKTVYELSKEHPDVIEIMKEIGFEDIAKPGMINTAGRFMTIVKGAKLKGISMEYIRESFKNKGFEIHE